MFPDQTFLSIVRFPRHFCNGQIVRSGGGTLDEAVTAKSRSESKPQRLLKAVAHPVRAKAFNVLMEEAASPKQISLLIGEEIHTVAYHVKVLEDMEVIMLVDT